MSAGERLPLAVAKRLAEEVIELIEDATVRVAIAGSIRRQQDLVGDVEVVVQPKWRTSVSTDLFGTVDETPISLFDERCQQLLDEGVFMKRLNVNGNPAWGSELKWGLYRGFGMDLYCATPDTWAVTMLLRTGPADFSKRVVTDRRHNGLCPSDLQFKGWRVRRRTGGDPLDTPDEASVFDALGMEYVAPERRFGGMTPPGKRLRL